MFQQIIAFGIFYLLVGALIAGKLLPNREFRSPQHAEEFTINWIIGWPLWLALSLSFWLAHLFYEEEGDD